MENQNSSIPPKTGKQCFSGRADRDDGGARADPDDGGGRVGVYHNESATLPCPAAIQSTQSAQKYNDTTR